ncbi:hypothetical protein F2Q70_00030266 [Brassica cretica]|uniref:Uncharacterized protein n=1 Tax=Brassica cretica TaxID=69181 RepID=A0A8S9FR14_BRACR|nr:hypothetical protein F2Q70_00030266 [Brassica cretica]KAF2549782.1 hypothetical protein F2Q68_00034735 [Brassica cretica]
MTSSDPHNELATIGTSSRQTHFELGLNKEIHHLIDLMEPLQRDELKCAQTNKTRHADSTIPPAHGSQQLRDDSTVTVRAWRYIHDDFYGDLFLEVSRSTLYPWLLAPMVQNTVFTDRSRNHPGVRSLIGIRSLSMTSRQ